jgi:dihydrolipoamide dehydrogenase
MVVGELAEEADLVVVGGGPGGYAAAERAAQLGREVLLIERAELGGCCLHVGCIPSKALIELADGAHRATRLRDAGLDLDVRGVDMTRFETFKQSVVDRLGRGVAGLLRSAGVTVVGGDARFSHPSRVAVELPDGTMRYWEFRDVILATGSRPVALPGLPFDGHTVLDSTAALAQSELPERLVVVGAGYIGVELGTAFAKLGVHVTFVEAADSILPGVDRALVRHVERRLEQLGVTLKLGALADHSADGELHLAGGERLPADKVIVAVGRWPNTDALGLDRLGIEPDAQGLIAVDERRLAAPRIAAVGDIVAGPALAHKAAAEGLVAAEALSGRATAFDPEAIPSVIFSDPEIATVGLTLEQARTAGFDAKASSFPLRASGRAATLGETDGEATVVIDAAVPRVIGVHIAGPHASELAAEGALAIELMASPEDLALTIHPHPTMSEALKDAAEAALSAMHGC